MNTLLSKDDILSESYNIDKSVIIYFIINKKKIVYIGRAILNNISVSIWEAIKRYIIEYDSYFLLRCSSEESSNLKAKYIIKFRPEYNLLLPKNDFYFSNSEINKVWLRKYGCNYKYVIDIDKMKSFKAIKVGKFLYYSIKDLKSIEPKSILNSNDCLDNNLNGDIYKLYYINNLSINKISTKLELDYDVVNNFIIKLKCNAVSKDKEENYVLKLYFCKEFSIEEINKSYYISKDHIINIITEYLTVLKDNTEWNSKLEVKEDAGYYQNNKDWINGRAREKRKIDPMFRLNGSISSGVYDSLIGNKNGHHWESLVNFTLNDLVNHIESQFVEGMTWENYGKDGWEIDHIIPTSWWKFESYNDDEFKQCWALCNLQPMWAKDNKSKGNRYCG